jgi:nucleoside-diphosphate-sugar epimerase
MKKILITGGAGFLGINLVRHLLKNNYNNIVSLDLADFIYPEKEYITSIKGDIRDKETLEKAMKGVDLVVHTAAALPLYSKEDIFSTDIKGTSLLVQAAHKARVQRFVHISSTAVYGIPDHHPIFEDDRLIGVGPYGEAKIKAEEVCLEYRQKGMCVPVLRPKSFIGPERLGVFALLYDWALSKKNFPMIGWGNNRYQLLDVEDLCRAIRLCLEMDKDLVNDTFNVGARDFTTMKEDYQAVLDAAGFNKKIIGFPAGPMIWTLRLLEMLKLSPLYKWVYETACEDSFVGIDKIEQKLGFVPEYSNKDALLRNFEWYKNNLHKFINTKGISHRVPWDQGILRYAKKLF